MAIVEDGSIILACGSLWIERSDGLIVGGDKRRDVVFVHHQIIGRDAGLPGIGELAIGDAGCSMIECVAFLHDDRRLATEFQRYRHKVFAGGPHHGAAHRRATREENMVEGKSRESCTYRGIAGHNGHLIVGKCIPQNGREKVAGCRRELGGLDHRPISCGDRRRERHQSERDRIVPWRHDADDA